MTIRNKILALTAATTIPMVALASMAHAEKDVNKAADSVVVTKTTYSYDRNGDGFIDPTEFNTYITTSIDSDGDGYLESTEYETSSMTYFYDTAKEDEVKSYTYWDKDKDNKLDSSEVETLVSNVGIYKKWDTNKDGKIDQIEFSAGTFKSYDDDNDGRIDMSEWSDVVM